MTYEIRQGNLFECEAEAHVNTINIVGVMGKGIALVFKQKYPAMFEDYRQACNKGLVKPGEMWVFDLGEEATNPRYIINFPTKRHWRQDSLMEDIKSGLLGLRRTLKEKNIKTVAIPPLGCGNGGLNWDLVKPFIMVTFSNSDELAYIYEPI